LRQGEALGLQWQDVHLTDGVLHVRWLSGDMDGIRLQDGVSLLTGNALSKSFVRPPVIARHGRIYDSN
jgi:integrase